MALPASLAPGALLAGKYRVEGELGRGGFGIVLRATQLNLGRPVAIKLLTGAATLREDSIARFRREARLVQRLEHPNTVRIYDFGELEDGLPFLCFELLRGRPLDRVILEEGRLSPARVVRVASQALKSLADAHQHGVVHRDVKPSNLFLCDYAGEADFVKVLDFGIAKSLGDEGGRNLTSAAIGPAQVHSYATAAHLTSEGSTLGTPAYMAPEQVCGEPVSPATDLYALGLVLAEALAGERVFQGTDAFQIGVEQLADRPAPLPAAALASPLGAVLARATRKAPRDRFQSAAEMLHALGALSVPTHPPSSWGAVPSGAPAGASAFATSPTMHGAAPAAPPAALAYGADLPTGAAVVVTPERPRPTLPMAEPAQPATAPSAGALPSPVFGPETGPGVAVPRPEARAAGQRVTIAVLVGSLVVSAAALTLVVGFVFLGWGSRAAAPASTSAPSGGRVASTAAPRQAPAPRPRAPKAVDPTLAAWFQPHAPPEGKEPPAIDVPGRRFCHLSTATVAERLRAAGFKAADESSTIVGTLTTTYSLASVHKVSGLVILQRFPSEVASKGAELGLVEDGGTAFGRDGLCTLSVRIDDDDGTAAKALLLEVTK